MAGSQASMRCGREVNVRTRSRAGQSRRDPQGPRRGPGGICISDDASGISESAKTKQVGAAWVVLCFHKVWKENGKAMANPNPQNKFQKGNKLGRKPGLRRSALAAGSTSAVTVLPAMPPAFWLGAGLAFGRCRPRPTVPSGRLFQPRNFRGRLKLPPHRARGQRW